MSKLIICPNCKMNDKPKILGSIDEEGNYMVIIGHNRGVKIVGSDYGSFCDSCGELVYFRQSVPQPLLGVKVQKFEFEIGTA